jgi:hypothetical protein
MKKNRKHLPDLDGSALIDYVLSDVPTPAPAYAWWMCKHRFASGEVVEREHWFGGRTTLERVRCAREAVPEMPLSEELARRLDAYEQKLRDIAETN